jgi:putative membrane protein insertion efficiency factor
MGQMPELYRRWVSPWLHSISGFSGACRFQPTCSEYAIAAVARHGVVVGAALALWRVLRCNPFGPGGFDPVPGTYPVAADQPPSLPHR